MADHLCVIVRSRPGEDERSFSTRLSILWSRLLRESPDEFEKVYAEMTQFARAGDCLTRTYLVHEDGIDRIERELAAAGLEHAPVDRDDLYSKYEAVAPEWMQIEH